MLKYRVQVFSLQCIQLKSGIEYFSRFLAVKWMEEIFISFIFFFCIQLKWVESSARYHSVFQFDCMGIVKRFWIFMLDILGDIIIKLLQHLIIVKCIFRMWMNKNDFNATSIYSKSILWSLFSTKQLSKSVYSIYLLMNHQK